MELARAACYKYILFPYYNQPERYRLSIQLKEELNKYTSVSVKSSARIQQQIVGQINLYTALILVTLRLT